MSKALLSVNDLQDRYSITRSTIYQWMKKAGMPKPVKIGTRTVRWRIEDIEEWEHSRHEAC